MFKNLTILYVEDEENIKEVVNSIFKQIFKNFIVASDGQEGLDLYIKYQDEIDVVVTDINMPNMNGLDMSIEIRKISTTVPIIITTAHNDKEFLHKAINVGINKFVTKPMDMKFLLDSIKQVVEPILLKEEFDKELKQYQDKQLQNAKFTATGQLAAGITHEINTPLTYIKANFEMLGYDIEDLPESDIKDDIIKSVEKIEDGLHRIETIVSSMREMSQQVKIEKKDANIYASVITSAILAYNKIKHVSNVYINGKEFNLDIDKNEYQFIANVELQRIEQVWIIIINNAMDELMKIDDYSKRRLDIDISEDENHITVLFKDTAGGIDPQIKDSIFEPFKGTKESSGMGVGLSIAKKIIDDQKNASIEAYNEGEGAVFKIILSK